MTNEHLKVFGAGITQHPLKQIIEKAQKLEEENKRLQSLVDALKQANEERGKVIEHLMKNTSSH